MDNILKST